MTDLILQLEARARLAEKHREARAALRASEAKSGPRDLTAGLAGRMARPGIGADGRAASFGLSSGSRAPPISES